MTLIIFGDNTGLWEQRDSVHLGVATTIYVRDGNGHGISGKLKIDDREYNVKFGSCTIKPGIFDKGVLDVKFIPEGKPEVKCEALRCTGLGAFIANGMDIESEVIKLRKYIDRLSTEISKNKKDDSVKILPFLAI